MKSKLIVLTLIGLLLTPTILLAQMLPEEPPSVAPITTKVQLVEKINLVAKALYTIIFALAVIFILISAFQFLTSAGNPEKIASARQMLIYALIAVAIALVAWGLPKLIKSLLSIT